MINPDYLIERKRNKKQLIRWKALTLFLIIFSLFAINKKINNKNFFSTHNTEKKDYIANIRIQEVIMDDLDRIKKINELGEDTKVKAILVDINSPGGSTVGSEMIYNSLKKISKTKPVVVVMNSLAASGGYLIALGGDYIVAHNGTITGSIGVIIQSAEVTALAEKMGIKFENFKSNPLKANPNPTEKTNIESRKIMLDSVTNVYEYFIEQVASRRNLDIEYVRKIADGRIYSGRQAYDLKLVDAVGDHETALEWLYKEKNISRDLDIIEKKLKSKENLYERLFDDFETKISSFFSINLSGIKLL